MQKIITVIVGVVTALVSGVVCFFVGRNKGHAKGVADGYVKASKTYEQKLLSQAKAFLNAKNDMAQHAAQKDRLIQALVALLKQPKVADREMAKTLLSQLRAA